MSLTPTNPKLKVKNSTCIKSCPNIASMHIYIFTKATQTSAQIIFKGKKQTQFSENKVRKGQMISSSNPLTQIQACLHPLSSSELTIPLKHLKTAVVHNQSWTTENRPSLMSAHCNSRLIHKGAAPLVCSRPALGRKMLCECQSFHKWTSEALVKHCKECYQLILVS